MIHSITLLLSGLSLLVFGYFIHIIIIGLGLFFLINGVVGFLLNRLPKHQDSIQSYKDEVVY